MSDLHTLLPQALDDVLVPEGDLAGAMARGDRLRSRRTTTRGLLAAATVTALVGGGAWLMLAPTGDDSGMAAGYPSLGELDLAGGLRAYADPGRVVNIGGRELPAKDLEFLDTDAVATSQGVVFFDQRDRALLLGADGEVVTFGPAPESTAKGWHASAKADSTGPRVAFTQRSEEGVRLQILDLDTRDVVATREVACQGKACEGIKVDAFDGGEAFVRTPEGYRLWDGADRWELVSGPKSRIADVRGGVVLYDASRPTPHPPSPYRAVRGAIDAQLTFDGRYILSWSSRLASTIPGERPLVLDQGPDGGLGFWTVDTDGSILLAENSSPGSATKPPRYAVYDCEVPSGSCTELGPLTAEGGDPMFIGNDM